MSRKNARRLVCSIAAISIARAGPAVLMMDVPPGRILTDLSVRPALAGWRGGYPNPTPIPDAIIGHKDSAIVVLDWGHPTARLRWEPVERSGVKFIPIFTQN